jgi:hypothetical protein
MGRIKGDKMNNKKLLKIAIGTVGLGWLCTCAFILPFFIPTADITLLTIVTFIALVFVAIAVVF